MKLSLIIISAIILSLFLVTGCENVPRETSVPTEPASASAWTDASGQATLSLGSFTVDATVQDVSQSAIANVQVTGYLGHNNILLTAYDTTGNFYPSITVTGLGTMAKTGAPSHVNSPEIAGNGVQATMVLYNLQQGASGFNEPAGLDSMVSDEWTAEQWKSGELLDIYRVMDTIPTYNPGIFIHLSQALAQRAGAPFRTAVFLPGYIPTFATFSSLAGLVFHLFDGDTLYFAQLNYAGALMPIMQIDNVIMHRNFWAQFTLTWDENPQDLDSHLWTPVIGPDSVRYHTCWYNPGAINDLPYDTLDVDDFTGWGPEHITVYRNFPGAYTYAIYHYSGSGTIASSEAVVTILKPDGSYQTLNAPSDTTGIGPNWWWHVCTVDGTTGMVTPINILSSTPPYPDILKDQPSKN